MLTYRRKGPCVGPEIKLHFTNKYHGNLNLHTSKQNETVWNYSCRIIAENGHILLQNMYCLSIRNMQI